MLYVILSLVLFSLTILGHILLHRLCVLRGVVSYKTIYLFGLGFLITCLVLYSISLQTLSTSWWNVSLPWAGSILYGLLAFLYYIYFGNAYLGEDSPSSRIFYHLEHGSKQYDEILTYFSDDAIVGKRIRNLIEAGLVKKESDKYVILPRGKFLMTIMEGYRRLMNWSTGG